MQSDGGRPATSPKKKTAFGFWSLKGGNGGPATRSNRTRRAVVVITLVVLAVAGIALATGDGVGSEQRQLRLGHKFLSEGKYEEAILAFTKAISIQPRSTEAYAGLGLAYGYSGDFDQAFTTLEGALDMGLNKPELLHEAMINVFLVKDDEDGAVVYLRSISDLGMLQMLARLFPELFQNIGTNAVLPSQPSLVSGAGNIPGNIVNGGNLAQHGDWIYHNYSFGISRTRHDGSSLTRITEDGGLYINVLNGWVYYHLGYPPYGMYRIRTDGSNRERLSEESIFYLTVVDDWIYGVWSVYGPLCKMRTDGSDFITLTEDRIWDMSVAGGWVYYSNGSDNGRLYKIRTDGTSRTKLAEESSRYVNAVGEWVYFSNSSDNRYIYRIRTDGSGLTKLNDDSSTAVNVIGDWIYYRDANWGGLYRIGIDGSAKKKLTDDNASGVQVSDDWVYYDITASDGGYRYRIRTDGSARQPFRP